MVAKSRYLRIPRGRWRPAMGRADGSGTTSSGRGRWIIMLVALSAGLIGPFMQPAVSTPRPGLWRRGGSWRVPAFAVVGLTAWGGARFRAHAGRSARVRWVRPKGSGGG